MRFFTLLSNDPNVSAEFKRAFCEATHTIPGTQEWLSEQWHQIKEKREAREQDIWDGERDDHLRDLARERAQRRGG